MMTDSTSNQTIVMMEDQLKMLEALHEIALSSDDAEMVRVALQALTNTQSGLAFLQSHPIVL